MASHIVDVFVDGSFEKAKKRDYSGVGICANVDGITEEMQFGLPEQSPRMRDRFEHYGVIESLVVFAKRFQDELSDLIITIKTDCKNAYDLFNGIQKKLRNVDRTFLKIFSFFKKTLKDLKVVWIPREENKLADKLANKARIAQKINIESIPLISLFDVVNNKEYDLGIV